MDCAQVELLQRTERLTMALVQVSLCGSFTRWVETVQMIPVDQSPGVFAVLVHLPAGCAAPPEVALASLERDCFGAAGPLRPGAGCCEVQAFACDRCTAQHGRSFAEEPAPAHAHALSQFSQVSQALWPASECLPRLCRYHQYKFIVDGEWRHDETQPFMPDPLGNVNNWLFVRQPDAAGCASHRRTLPPMRTQ